VQPLDYLLTAKELSNHVENAKNNKVLEQFLSQATIMVVSVTASTTQGVQVFEK
jgi:U4/U6 small nuclear ribonucleoprotein PRP31